jgi:hypothetical protein
MCKNSLLSISLVLFLFQTPLFAVIGPWPFDASTDVGLFEPATQIGSTTYSGPGEYTIVGVGGDIWDDYDQFQFAYKLLSGSVRFSADFTWVDKGRWSNDWGKMGAMLRYTTDPRSQHYSMFMRELADGVFAQYRDAYGGGSGSTDLWGVNNQPIKFGIQRVVISPAFSVVEALYDTGSGWQVLGGARLITGMPSDVLYGAAVTSHDQWRFDTNKAKVTNVNYEQDVMPITQFPKVPESGSISECPTQIPGFKIRGVRVGMGMGWPSANPNDGYNAMNQLLDTGEFPTGIIGEDDETRISQVVNLHDSEGRGEFNAANGYPDESFPGIDAFESPTQSPADLDDDNNFACEVIACIHLTQGWHVIGANSDDGTIITIGGVEIGRAAEWKGTSNADFLFYVEAEGNYPLRARMLEGGGGSALELHEILPTGLRILLGDVARGGSPVYVPEPATIALLGLGGLTLFSIRRKR